jgi:hypothetical protein
MDQTVFDQQDPVCCLGQSIIMSDHHERHSALTIHFPHQLEDLSA